MTTERPIDLDALTLEDVLGGALRGRPVAVLGLARSGLALARFFADAGATVTAYDGRPIDELADGLGGLEGRPVRLLAGPEVDPTSAWAGAALVATSPSINPDYPTTEPRLRRALQELSLPGMPRTRRPRPHSSRRRICSCGCARRRPSASPARRARRRRRR